MRDVILLDGYSHIFLPDGFNTSLNLQSLVKRTSYLTIGHYTHIRNIDTAMIETFEKTIMIVICLPPHCTHRMQPIDIGFMKPLKTYYAHEIETWLRNNPGRTLSNKYVCKLFGAAYEQAVTMSRIIKFCK